MKTVCAWCNTVIRDGECPVSVGMCDSCAKDFDLQQATGDFTSLLNDPAHEARLERVNEFPAATTPQG